MIIPAPAQAPVLLTNQSLEGGGKIRPVYFTFKVMQWNSLRDSRESAPESLRIRPQTPNNSR